MTAGRQSDENDNLWRLYRGPANWFTFRCPEVVEVRQNQTLIELRLPMLLPRDSSPNPARQVDSDPESTGGGYMMSMVTWWEEQDGDSAGRQPPDLTLLFPQVVSLHPEPTLDMTSENEAWGGISRRTRRGCWLARVFRRKPHYQWRLWTIRSGRLTIVATVQSADHLALNEGFVSLCEQILRTLQIADRPAWPPDVFLKQVMELARHHFPLLHTSVSRGFSLRLGHSEIGLSNFYRMYLQQPDQFRRIVLPGLTTLVRLQELGPEQLIPQLDEVRSHILPMLSSDDDSRTDARVRIPWVAGLSIGYVVDEDDSYRFVHQEMLNSWKLSEDDLHELALENLRDYVERNPIEMTMLGDEEQPRMLMPVKPDAYNCSRILDAEFHNHLRQLFGPELIVGVPNRDFFVAVALSDPELIEQVRHRVNEDFVAMHHPLTSRLLLISPDGVSEYCEG